MGPIPVNGFASSCGAFIGALLFAGVMGCASDPAPPAPAASSDAGPEPGSLCPSREDPRVHYRDQDPNACRAVTLDCTAEQNGFDNACGCGCIDKGDPLCPPVDDPAITWVSRDPAECEAARPICPRGELPFNSSCGCGCTRPGG